MDFSGRRLLVFRIQFSLVRQWLHVASVYEAFWKNFTHFFGFDTKHTFYELCLPSERGWFWYGFGRPSLEREVHFIFVFTAPVAELNVVSFTVPLNGWIIAATATVVISCSSADMCCGSVCVAMSCGGGFTPGGAYDSVWDSVKPMTGKFFFLISSFKRSLGVYAC